MASDESDSSGGTCTEEPEVRAGTEELALGVIAQNSVQDLSRGTHSLSDSYVYIYVYICRYISICIYLYMIYSCF